MQTKKLRPQALVEIIFDLGYLAFAAIIGVYLLMQQGEMAQIYGALAIVLCGGDAFHLIPRVFALATNGMEKHTKALGFGKFVTSITMTIFYVLLYYIWQAMYEIVLPAWLAPLVLALAAARILLCFFPQNEWFSKSPSLRFAIYRNIPFACLGAIVAGLFAISGTRGYADGFEFMAVAIALSFVFYFIVVLFAGKNKKLGAFMLPKTCAYIWILCMGLSLVK